MRLLLDNMKAQVGVSGKRRGRGQRAVPFERELLRAHAGALAVDELQHILDEALANMSSEDEEGAHLSSDEVANLKRDVAAASLLFRGAIRGGGGGVGASAAAGAGAAGGERAKMNSRERAKLASLARALAPAVAKSGEAPSEAAQRIRGLFASGLSSTEARDRLRSFLGASGMSRLRSALTTASRSVPSAAAERALSRSGSSASKQRAVKAALLRGEAARSSRSGDEAAAGTSTRSFLTGSVGSSQRTARSATRTSSKSARTGTGSSSSLRGSLRTPSSPIARRRARRAPKPVERLAAAEGALLVLDEVAGDVRRAAKQTGSKARRKEHDERVAYVVHLLLDVPGRLDEEQRRRLGKQIRAVFPRATEADRERLLQLFAHKAAASELMRSDPKTRLRALLQRILTDAELRSLQNEMDWVSSVSPSTSRSGRSSSSRASPSRILSEPVVQRSRLGRRLSLDEAAISSARKPRRSA